MRFSPMPQLPGKSVSRRTVEPLTRLMLRPVWLGLIALLLACSACSQPKQGDPANVRAVQNTHSLNQTQLALIATDLVTALLQVGSLSPFATTLQVSEPPSDFGRAVLLALEYGGYGLQEVELDQGSHYLSYASRTSMNQGGLITDYIIHVGDVSIRRAYDLRNNVLLPVSAMYVRGAEATDTIQLNDAIFLQQGAQVSFDNRVNLDTGPIAGVVTANRSVTGYANNAPKEYDQRSALLWAQNLLLEKHNNPRSPDLSGYVPVQRTEIEFMDSSMYLGFGNKRAIESLVTAYRPDSDLFYLIACTVDQSVSSTTSAHSQRVLEEFLLHGTPEDKIFNKPCSVNDRRLSAHNSGSVIILHYRMNP